ncbi:molybdopterin molybdotransferase MoeA [uncultured Flavonifractor sp.]|uniref:molybdopterin molybdotransferase MoeA n=1 Tax=uncultured Flavonifractor sp. TaxID=1193534 RepID=UPI0026702EBD|nr:gephyrin-like molybdotransferase Glp [uncultured Flavonifractor sp.]
MLTVMTPEELLTRIANIFGPLDRPPETVGLDCALGRVLAQDILAEEYVPGFDRSTVDGYALRGADTFGCSESIPALLTCTGAVEMGKEPAFAVGPYECAAIPTGGALPEGADAVQMVEHTEDYGGGEIGIVKSVPPGANLIFKGDDVKPGDLVLRKGRRLEPQDVGALAALGVTQVPVVPKLRVGLISTGDELVSPEGDPGPGQVRDVNGPLVAALLAQAGAEAVPLGIVPDREELLREAVEEALETCDCVVLSGGSSVGEKDAACRVMASLGEVLCHGVAMKPGKPTLLGKAGGKPILGLPGHPVAALFTAKLFLIPLLARLEGRTWAERTVSARLAQTVPANHGRAQYTGVTLEEKPDGLWAVPIWGKSGLITTLAGADGFFCVPRDREGIPAGESVEVSLFG